MSFNFLIFSIFRFLCLFQVEVGGIYTTADHDKHHELFNCNFAFPFVIMVLFSASSPPFLPPSFFFVQLQVRLSLGYHDSTLCSLSPLPLSRRIFPSLFVSSPSSSILLHPPLPCPLCNCENTHWPARGVGAGCSARDVCWHNAESANGFGKWGVR
jgi:hypothetical protein